MPKRGVNQDEYFDNSEVALSPDEMAVVRSRWDDIAGTHRGWGAKLFDLVPALPASLESLVKQGYTGPLIAEMFGVSPGTVHGWVRMMGLRLPRVGQFCVRVWSDAEACFISIPTSITDRMFTRPIRAKNAARSDGALRRFAKPGERERLLAQLAGVRDPLRARRVYMRQGMGIRAEGKSRVRQRSAARTHCRKGHPRTPENIYVRPDNGHLDCVPCRSEAQERWNARRRGEKGLAQAS